MALITKSDILEGIYKVEKKKIKALDGELYLRPLSAAELDEISYIEAEGMGNFEQNSRSKGRNLNQADLTQTSKFNMLKVTKATDAARYKKIELSLDNPKNQADPWTIDEIKKFPMPAIEELEKIINEMSGVEVTSNDVKQFLADESS